MALSRRLCAALFASLACAVTAQAAQPELSRVGSMKESARPAGVPLDYVITPNGYFHASCVVAVDEGDIVSAQGEVVHADGSVRKLAACAHPSFDPAGRVHTEVYNGWIADSSTDPGNTPASNEMKASWIVPSAPSNANGQTLYFFPGLEQSPGVVTILQPVLGWNGYGDSAWTMTNWNCCKSGSTFHGPAIPVSTGDKIEGTMKGTCNNGQPCANWNIVSKDVTTGQSTTFKTSAFGQAFNWWFGGAMETYGVSTCDQFPANGSITFNHIKTFDVNFNKVTPTWQDNVNGGGAPNCGYAVTTTASTTKITFTP
jgi:hypothetical protein